MKILQVINNLTVAGAEVLLRDLILGLKRRGIECELYSLRSIDSPLERALREVGIKMFSPARTSVYSPVHIRHLKAHLQANRYDVIHVHLFPAQLWAAMAEKSVKTLTPLVTTEHNTSNRRRRSAFKPIDRLTYAQYDSIACVSDAVREALVRWLPEVSNKVWTCPNGIDVTAFAEAPTLGRSVLFSLPEKCPVIVSVGRMEYQKDHGTTIRALNLIPDAHLILVGSGPELLNHQKLAQQLHLSERCHFLGQRTDIAQIMKASDICVQSSRFEGFGIAALEAMASGLPVIASRVPGLAELVSGAGLLFEAGDFHDLAKQLNLLFGSTELRTKFADAGRKRASEFSIEKALDAHEKLYEELDAR